ncbi:DUF3833 domain-containing protein [Thalassotalea ganghwensis]
MVAPVVSRFFMVMFCVFIFGCGASLLDYRNTTPKLKLDDYFNGPIVAWGMIQDYQDKVTRRFCVELNGSWQKNEGLLKETFYFDDGEVSYRDWYLTRQVDGTYTGKADDVIGQASGRSSGMAFRWNYTLSIDIDGKNYQFNMDDWMYQLDDYRLFNRTAMKKFGIEVAHITLFFDKEQPLRQCQG